MENYYYRETLWSVNVALLNMFNGMKVYKFDDNGDRVKEIEVPITNGPVEKTHQTRTTDFPGDGERYYLQIPRMALVCNGMTFNPDRSYSPNEKRFWSKEVINLSGTDLEFEDWQPVPYDYNFTLFIRTDRLGMLAQIIENITPYFAPSAVLRVKEFTFLNIERDLPVYMGGGINFDFTDDLDTGGMREVNASIDLTVHGWSYKRPTSTDIVKIINSRYYVGNGIAYSYDTSGNPISATYDSSATPTEVDASFAISGFNTSGDMPDPSAYDISGYNADTDVYWTETYTLSGDS